LETDRDGLLDLKQADLQISVSPDLLQRGIRAYDAALRAAVERGWPLKIIEGVVLRIIISREPLELAVMEKTEPANPGGQSASRRTASPPPDRGTGSQLDGGLPEGDGLR